MVSMKKYLKALKIVNAYHEQIQLQAQSIINPTQIYKELEQVQIGDQVKCIYVHSSSTNHLTIEKQYQVLNTDHSRFMIQVDSNRKKWYYKTNNHFRLL